MAQSGLGAHKGIENGTVKYNACFSVNKSDRTQYSARCLICYPELRAGCGKMLKSFHTSGENVMVA